MSEHSTGSDPTFGDPTAPPTEHLPYGGSSPSEPSDPSQPPPPPSTPPPTEHLPYGASSPSQPSQPPPAPSQPYGEPYPQGGQPQSPPYGQPQYPQGGQPQYPQQTYPQPGYPQAYGSTVTESNSSAIVLLVLSLVMPFIGFVLQWIAMVPAIVALAKADNDTAGSRRWSRGGWVTFWVLTVLQLIALVVLIAVVIWAVSTSPDPTLSPGDSSSPDWWPSPSDSPSSV